MHICTYAHMHTCTHNNTHAQMHTWPPCQSPKDRQNQVVLAGECVYGVHVCILCTCVHIVHVAAVLCFLHMSMSACAHCMCTCVHVCWLYVQTSVQSIIENTKNRQDQVVLAGECVYCVHVCILCACVHIVHVATVLCLAKSTSQLVKAACHLMHTLIYLLSLYTACKALSYTSSNLHFFFW